MTMAQVMRKRLFVFRMTHIENVPFILRNGLWSKLSDVQDPAFKAIGNRRQAEWRAKPTA